MGRVALALVLALTLVGCARTLNYPSQGGPPLTLGEPVAPPPKAAPQPAPPPAEATPKPAAPPPAASAAVGSASISDDLVALLLYGAKLIGDHHVEIDGKRYRVDCSKYVRAVFDTIGVDLFDEAAPPGSSGTRIIYELVREYGYFHKEAPSPGDLVFFHNTYDRDGDGRRDDLFTHVAIVEEVREDGTVFILHAVSKGISRYHMNLSYPGERHHPESGEVINDWLRRAEGGQSSKTTAELFYTFGQLTLWGRS